MNFMENNNGSHTLFRTGRAILQSIARDEERQMEVARTSIFARHRLRISTEGSIMWTRANPDLSDRLRSAEREFNAWIRRFERVEEQVTISLDCPVEYRDVFFSVDTWHFVVKKVRHICFSLVAPRGNEKQQLAIAISQPSSKLSQLILYKLSTNPL